MRPFVIVEDKWRLAPDKESFMLQEARTVKGELTWRAEGYYVKLTHAFEGCLRKQILQSEEDLPLAIQESLKSLQTAVDRLRQGLTVPLDVPDEEGGVEQELILL